MAAVDFFDLHRVQADQRAHARIQHRQDLLDHRQQVLQQPHGFQRLAHGRVVDQLQRGGVRQTGEAGHALLLVGLRNGFTQTKGIAADQRAAVVRQAPGRLGQTLALHHVVAGVLRALHRGHRRVNRALQQRRRAPLHFQDALL